jgi:tRNA A-37 threonylcarbamoyl transferase component Bud32
MRPGSEPFLLGPQGLRLDEWLQSGQAQQIKDGPHRTVYRIDLPERSFYLKRYARPPWWRAVWSYLRGSPSQREWQNTLALLQKKIPTAVPLAWGQSAGPGSSGENYFVSQALPQTVTLAEFLRLQLPALAPAEQALVRRQLAQKLGAFCARLHAAGVEHNDFHAGNVLVRCARQGGRSASRPSTGAARAAGQPFDQRAGESAGGESLAGAAIVELFLIDVPGIRLGRPLNARRSIRSLVMFGAGLMAFSSPTDRMRFWRSYLAGRPDLPLPPPRKLAASVNRALAAYGRRVGFQRDKRCLRDNRDFYALATPGAMAHAVRDVPRGLLASLMADPEGPIRQFRHVPAKISHSSVVVEARLDLDSGTVPVAYKRCRTKSWWKAWLFPCRRNRALRNWLLGCALLSRGIPVARPLLVVVPRRGLDGYLAVQWLNGAANLHLKGWQWAVLPEQQRRKKVRAAAVSLGRLVGKMHAWGISHRDLKGCNLVFTETGDQIDAYLIDLDGVRVGRHLALATRAHNLARLAASLEAHEWVTHTDRMRFWRAYVRELRPEPIDGKALWRATAARCEDLVQNKRRRNQPVA